MVFFRCVCCFFFFFPSVAADISVLVFFFRKPKIGRKEKSKLLTGLSLSVFYHVLPFFCLFVSPSLLNRSQDDQKFHEFYLNTEYIMKIHLCLLGEYPFYNDLFFFGDIYFDILST